MEAVSSPEPDLPIPAERRDESSSYLDKIGEGFETVGRNELRLVFMGEIISASDFPSSSICVHYLVELPKGWKNDSVLSVLEGVTHGSRPTGPTRSSHFSHDFFGQLTFSMSSVDEDETYSRPLMLLMVMGMEGRRMRNEGYAYVPIPSSPGHHSLTVRTWKPARRSIQDKLMDVFLDLTPALQDIKTVHIQASEAEDCHRTNRLGFETEPSGSIQIRFQIIHQTHSMDSPLQNHKIDLLEKMSSTRILRSVQAVIEAFQQAQKKAAALYQH